jgi:peptidoglycan/xylan/chitin deacetylase (PgdA/CDA1 family)
LTTEIAFKVDVCNHRALHAGLPELLRTFDRAGAPASIFVSFGPDNSGKAIRRIFRRGFVSKMLRTRAPRMYGVRTLLSGTLLPALPVGESAPDLLRSAEAAGHPVGLHGFDHVGWQDGVAKMDEAVVRASYARSAALFSDTLGHAPRFSGAPGWQVTEASLRVQDELGLAFASDCRGGTPFYPAQGGGRARTLQIPTTLPTSDELLAAGAARAPDLAAWYDAHLEPERVNVVGVHAEAEGIHFAEWLRRWLDALRERAVSFVSLADVADRERASAATCRVVARELPGRSGTVACPEPHAAANR